MPKKEIVYICNICNKSFSGENACREANKCEKDHIQIQTEDIICRYSKDNNYDYSIYPINIIIKYQDNDEIGRLYVYCEDIQLSQI